jgi:hypothetical protein
MHTTDQSPIYLTILRTGNTNIIDIVEVGALIPRSEAQVDAAFLQELATEITRTAIPTSGPIGATPLEDTRQPSAIVPELQRIGGLIFSHLLTEPVRRRLRASDSGNLYLRLDEQLVHLPWELCYDGRDFLATKFRVGRQVITGYPIPETVSAPLTPEVLKILLIADPTESLPEASHEAEQLCSLLDDIPGVEVKLLPGWGHGRLGSKFSLRAASVWYRQRLSLDWREELYRDLLGCARRRERTLCYDILSTRRCRL